MGTYAAPQPSYAAQEVTYAVPQATHAAPQPSYAAQQVTYVAPQATYVAQQPSFEPPMIYPAPAQPAYEMPQQQYVYASSGVAAQAPMLKAQVGDWQICEDAQGEYYVHVPSNQTFDQAPLELLQLLSQ